MPLPGITMQVSFNPWRILPWKLNLKTWRLLRVAFGSHGGQFQSVGMRLLDTYQVNDTLLWNCCENGRPWKATFFKRSALLCLLHAKHMTELTESPARFRDSKYTQNLTILRVAAGARCLCPSLEYPQVWVTNCSEIEVKPFCFEGQPDGHKIEVSAGFPALKKQEPKGGSSKKMLTHVYAVQL